MLFLIGMIFGIKISQKGLTMTRKEAKEMLLIIRTFANGETIECNSEINLLKEVLLSFRRNLQDNARSECIEGSLTTFNYV